MPNAFDHGFRPSQKGDAVRIDASLLDGFGGGLTSIKPAERTAAFNSSRSNPSRLQLAPLHLTGIAANISGMQSNTIRA